MPGLVSIGQVISEKIYKKFTDNDIWQTPSCGNSSYQPLALVSGKSVNMCIKDNLWKKITKFNSIIIKIELKFINLMHQKSKWKKYMFKFFYYAFNDTNIAKIFCWLINQFVCLPVDNKYFKFQYNTCI